MMFSATFPQDMQRLAADFMQNYIFLKVGRVGSSVNLIIQSVDYITPTEKNTVLLDLINSVEVSPWTSLSTLVGLFSSEWRSAKHEADSCRNPASCGLRS
jgi:superfamily II DNA/RNA helicase